MSGTDTNKDNEHQTYELPHQIISASKMDNIFDWSANAIPHGFKSHGETPNMGLLDYGLKDKIFDSTFINANVGANFKYVMEITADNIVKPNLTARTTHQFWRCGAKAKFQINGNDSYQGLLMIVYESWPYPDYYTVFLKYGQPRLGYNWQVPHVPMLVNQKNPVEVDIPMDIYPFNYFTFNFASALVRESYLTTYPLGRIAVNAITPVLTRSDVLTLPFIVTTRLTDLIGYANKVSTSNL